MPNRKKGTSLEENTRAKIAKYLPDAIDHAMQSYRNFYQNNEHNEVKEFSAHHTACKVAIAHVELLIKLAAIAQLPRADTDGDLAMMMMDAQSELARYRDIQDDV